MPNLFRIDISKLGNGVGAEAYGGFLDAYSFLDIDQLDWFSSFIYRVKCSMDDKVFLPIIRIADGELRLLFPLLSFTPFKSRKKLLQSIKALLLFVGLIGFKTSWGEAYSHQEALKYRYSYYLILKYFSRVGILALYWNNNALNAFTDHAHKIENRLKKLGVVLNEDNYYPFHFPLAIFLRDDSVSILEGKKVLFVSSISHHEQDKVRLNLKRFNLKSINFLVIPKNSAHKLQVNCCGEYDIVFVSGGISSISIIYQLRHLSCPCIDIGGVIHLLSGERSSYHGGFFHSLSF
jgi:hypothetical protein